MLRDERYKLIRLDASGEQLYDLVDDPAESTNLLGGPLSPGEAEALGELRGALDAIIASAG